MLLKGTPLTNFYEHKFSFEGVEWITREAAFQAGKAVIVKDMQAYKALQNMTGAQARQAGRSITMTKQELDTWNSVKKDRMYQVAKAAFEQVVEYRQAIMNTPSEHLVETSPWDNFWGSKTGIETPYNNQYGKIMRRLQEETKMENITLTYGVANYLANGNKDAVKGDIEVTNFAFVDIDGTEVVFKADIDVKNGDTVVINGSTATVTYVTDDVTALAGIDLSKVKNLSEAFNNNEEETTMENTIINEENTAEEKEYKLPSEMTLEELEAEKAKVEAEIERYNSADADDDMAAEASLEAQQELGYIEELIEKKKGEINMENANAMINENNNKGEIEMKVNGKKVVFMTSAETAAKLGISNIAVDIYSSIFAPLPEHNFAEAESDKEIDTIIKKYFSKVFNPIVENGDINKIDTTKVYVGRNVPAWFGYKNDEVYPVGVNTWDLRSVIEALAFEDDDYDFAFEELDENNPEHVAYVKALAGVTEETVKEKVEEPAPKAEEPAVTTEVNTKEEKKVTKNNRFAALVNKLSGQEIEIKMNVNAAGVITGPAGEETNVEDLAGGFDDEEKYVLTYGEEENYSDYDEEFINEAMQATADIVTEEEEAPAPAKTEEPASAEEKVEEEPAEENTAASTVESEDAVPEAKGEKKINLSDQKGISMNEVTDDSGVIIPQKLIKYGEYIRYIMVPMNRQGGIQLQLQRLGFKVYIDNEEKKNVNFSNDNADTEEKGEDKVFYGTISVVKVDTKEKLFYKKGMIVAKTTKAAEAFIYSKEYGWAVTEFGDIPFYGKFWDPRVISKEEANKLLDKGSPMIVKRGVGVKHAFMTKEKFQLDNSSATEITMEETNDLFGASKTDEKTNNETSNKVNNKVDDKKKAEFLAYMMKERMGFDSTIPAPKAEEKPVIKETPKAPEKEEAPAPKVEQQEAPKVEAPKTEQKIEAQKVEKKAEAPKVNNNVVLNNNKNFVTVAVSKMDLSSAETVAAMNFVAQAADLNNKHEVRFIIRSATADDQLIAKAVKASKDFFAMMNVKFDAVVVRSAQEDPQIDGFNNILIGGENAMKKTSEITKQYAAEWIKERADYVLVKNDGIFDMVALNSGTTEESKVEKKAEAPAPEVKAEAKAPEASAEKQVAELNLNVSNKVSDETKKKVEKVFKYVKEWTDLYATNKANFISDFNAFSSSTIIAAILDTTSYKANFVNNNKEELIIDFESNSYNIIRK